MSAWHPTLLPPGPLRLAVMARWASEEAAVQRDVARGWEPARLTGWRLRLWFRLAGRLAAHYAPELRRYGAPLLAWVNLHSLMRPPDEPTIAEILTLRDKPDDDVAMAVLAEELYQARLGRYRAAVAARSGRLM